MTYFNKISTNKISETSHFDCHRSSSVKDGSREESDLQPPVLSIELVEQANEKARETVWILFLRSINC